MAKSYVARYVKNQKEFRLEVKKTMYNAVMYLTALFIEL